MEREKNRKCTRSRYEDSSGSDNVEYTRKKQVNKNITHVTRENIVVSSPEKKKKYNSHRSMAHHQ